MSGRAKEDRDDHRSSCGRARGRGRAASPRHQPEDSALFILGDILGAGNYALVAVVAGEVGGAIWTAFGVALVLALLTAFAYAELVTKYPHAGGAALYVNKAFRQPFLTFMVCVAVAASGLTSAATLSRAFGGDYLGEFVSVPTTIAALVFLVVISFINFRGISESIKLTLVNISVLVLRREPVAHEHFVAPSVFPIAGAVVSIAMLIKLLTHQESSLPLVIVVVLLAGGAALWWINRLVLGRTEQIDPTKLPA